MDLVNQFAAQHPFIFAGLAIASSRVVPFLIGPGAKWVVKQGFAFQRARLKALGVPDAKIDAIMEDEADFLVNAGKEAKAEADAARSADSATPPPAAS